MADQPAVSRRDTIQVVTQAFTNALPDRDFIIDDEVADAFSAAMAALESHTGRKLPERKERQNATAEQEAQPWWSKQDCLKLRLEHGEALNPVHREGTIIVKAIGGKSMRAHVPTEVMPPNLNYVPVQYAGHTADKVLIYFPVGNEGRDSWFIPTEQYRQLVSQEAPPAHNPQGDTTT